MLLPVWNKKEKIILRVISYFWLIASAIFFIWWFQKSHIGTTLGFILTSFVFIWIYLLQGYCIFFILKMKRLDLTLPTVKNVRVAMVVTKTPSEPFEMVKTTLKGMISQQWEVHDNWVADENPNAESLAWYKENNIHVSCRKDDPLYHNHIWPRRKKSKEGNLAYFYDKYGYEKYDFVVHLDVDHVPEPDYLEHILRPFSDSTVGYVCAASVCDTNSDESWAARARSSSEAMFHGPIQAGSNGKWIPLCIGSHYAVRTKALKEIGGIGPELAEDYSTTLMMNGFKWKGIYTYDAEAHGNGPQSFNDVMIQDYQWARSLMILFLTFFSKYLKRLSWRKKIGFTLTQLWYSLSAVAWLIGIIIPITTLLTGNPPVKVNFIEFLLFSSAPYLLSITIYLFVKIKGHLRPHNVSFFSWENSLFEIARWPWIVVACIEGAFLSFKKTKPVSRVTPKDKSSIEFLNLRIILPYILIILINCYSVIFGKYNHAIIGYYWFSILIILSYSILLIAVARLHIIENDLKNKKDEFKKLGANFYVTITTVVAAIVILFSYNSQFINLNKNIMARENNPIIVHAAPLIKINEIQYTVKEGDNLIFLADRFYGQPNLWTKIYDANKSKIILRADNFAIIHPDTILIIPQ
jgi:cellulose synthase (UDP-forming)